MAAAVELSTPPERPIHDLFVNASESEKLPDGLTLCYIAEYEFRAAA